VTILITSCQRDVPMSCELNGSVSAHGRASNSSSGSLRRGSARRERNATEDFEDARRELVSLPILSALSPSCVPDHQTPVMEGSMAVKNFSMQCGPLVAAFIIGALFGSTFAAGVPPALYPLHQSLDVGESPNEFGCGTMSDEGRPACEIHRDENNDVFVLVAGTKIAKRGLPGTAQANTWIMLELGWMVRDAKGGTAIVVRYERTRMQSPG
jgi:hypothetical protein